MASADLQSLIECGKVTDTVEIDGKKFRLSTLSDDAQETVFRKFSATAEDAGNFVDLRRTVVAMAVETFDGRPFEDLYRPSGDERPDSFGKRLALVRLMQGQVVDKIYSFYEELIKRSRQRIDPEQAKN